MAYAGPPRERLANTLMQGQRAVEAFKGSRGFANLPIVALVLGVVNLLDEAFASAGIGSSPPTGLAGGIALTVVGVCFLFYRTHVRRLLVKDDGCVKVYKCGPFGTRLHQVEQVIEVREVSVLRRGTFWSQVSFGGPRLWVATAKLQKLTNGAG